MAALLSSGTVSYNSVQFTSLYRTNISAKFIQDEAKRANIYVEYVLEVDAYLALQTTDATLADYRKKLSKPAGILIYKNKGFGDLVVNEGKVKDVAWGPTPEILDWQSVGDANACLVKWRVTTRIPECDAANYQFALLAWNFTWATAIDEDGYTSRTISGYLEIPLTRDTPTQRRIGDTADRYRDQVRPEIPEGFQRTNQTFEVSKDRRRADFVFTDVELAMPLPDYCTKVDSRFVIESKTPLIQWQCTLSATITVTAGQPKTLAFGVFLLILRSRLQKRFAPNLLGWLLNLRCEEDTFGRTATFSASVRVTGTQLADMLKATQIWRPVDGTDNRTWAISIRQLAAHERGSAGLYLDNADDAIVDLCLNKPPPKTSTLVTTGKTGVGGGKPSGGNNPGGPGGGGGGGNNPGGGNSPGGSGGRPGGGNPVGDPHGGTFTIPGTSVGSGGPSGGLNEFTGALLSSLRPENSWLIYQPRIRFLEKSNVSVHKPLPPSGKNVPVGPVVDAEDDTKLNLLRNKTSAPRPAQQTPTMPADIVQRTASPSRWLELSGVGVRVGYRVNPPQLLNVGGVVPIELEREIVEDQPGALGGVQLFRTAWRILYLLPSLPSGGLPYLANPANGTEGGTGGSTLTR